ncbi:hypothetical protein ACFVSN_43305 [Kitasatospora sp. NPDC057904]|uniref:hypothetical protein n=1 Tax=unclassified Kitasatospora TaxID=2633591 RepID=UPI0036DD9604
MANAFQARWFLLYCLGLSVISVTALCWPTPTPFDSGRPSPAALVLRTSAQLNCSPDTAVDTPEMAESDCSAADVHYRLLTFADDSAKCQWLGLAKDYGGTYVTGERWVVVPWPDAMAGQVHRMLGGSVETGDSHLSHPEH